MSTGSGIDVLNLDVDLTPTMLLEAKKRFPGQIIPVPNMDFNSVDTLKFNLWLDDWVKETSADQHHFGPKKKVLEPETGKEHPDHVHISKEIDLALDTKKEDTLDLNCLVAQSRLAMAKLISKDAELKAKGQSPKWSNEFIKIHSGRPGGDFFRFYRHFAIIAILNAKKAEEIITLARQKFAKAQKEADVKKRCTITNLKALILDIARNQMRPLAQKHKSKKFYSNLRNIFSTYLKD
jgi:hypothetical protein